MQKIANFAILRFCAKFKANLNDTDNTGAQNVDFVKLKNFAKKVESERYTQ